MKPEDLLHLFAPYLPTDRFRALLRGVDLPTTSEGAALQVDTVGFTPMTTQLVADYGAERAADELERRLNPMFEAVAGQVFHHGGSVINFAGDGFVAWFDDHPICRNTEADVDVPGVFRALAAGLEMQAVMSLFRGLQLKVCIGAGTAFRWVVGLPQYGLSDVLSGPAVDAMITLAGETQPGQVLIHHDMVPLLRSENVNMELAETDNATVIAIPDALFKAARHYRWPAWAVEGDIDDVLNTVRPFVDAVIRERVESGFGDFVAELRYAVPVFIRLGGLKPQAANTRPLLDIYVRSAQEVLANSGGRCVSVEVNEKGTIVFAVFGTPITYGDDTERGVRAALSLRDMAIARENGITQRIGVSRGLMYAGTIGGEMRHEYSTIGDETNIASRLMSAADIGQILVSASVCHEIGPRILFKELQPVVVKGKVEPIPVAEPIAIQAGARTQKHVGQFVGREGELAWLRQSLETVFAGRPQIVHVEGQAGIGKSRLVAELIRMATGQHQIYVASGDSVSTERNISYLPWRNIMISLLGLNVESDLREIIDHLSCLIELANPNWLPRLPLLGDLLELPIPDTPMTATLEGQNRRQGLFALVTDLIMYSARQQPVLLILEDMQWIDEVSDALAVELARRLSVDPAPVMLVLVHRPLTEADQPPALLRVVGELSVHRHIVVDELTLADVTHMIEDHLRAPAPPELIQSAYERTHGNPLFVQEVIGALLETGHIRVENGVVTIARDLKNADLPRTVQGLVLARVDRLNETDKLVLKVAAVIGREFQVRILAESIPVQMSYDELLARLRTLEERDFSRQETAEPELSYAFKHAITQEVTYQSLLLVQREQLHYAVATALETFAPDAIERLAYHFTRGGSSARARRYLALAGQRAFREYANQAALDYFTQAFELEPDDEERFEINCQRLQVLARLGDTQGIQAELPAMRQLATSYNRLDWQATIHLLWANYYTQTSDWARVIDEAQKAAAIARQNHDDTLAWDAYRLLHSAFTGLNQREEARVVIHLMQPLAERLGDRRRAIELALLQVDDLYDESPERAVEGTRAALAQAREVGDPTLTATCWSALARLSLRANDLPAALDAARQQIGLLRQIGDRRGEGLTLNQIGIILVSLGQFSEGNDHLLDAYKILHQIGERSGEAISFVYLGLIAAYRKAYGEALAYMDRGLAIQQALSAEADAALTLFHKGNVYIARNEIAEATRCLDEARTFLLASNIPQQIDEVYTALAEIDMRRGDHVAARAHVGPLLDWLRERKGRDLVLPGLAYWRSIQVLEKCGEWEQAAQLRQAFRAEAQAMLDRLVDPLWREGYVNNIWYHAALLKG